MPDKHNHNRIDWLVGKVPISHAILSLIFGIASLFIYLIFIPRDEFNIPEYNFNYLLQILFFCTTITYLLIGNQYIIKQAKKLFQAIEFIGENDDRTSIIYSQFEASLFKSKKFLIVLAVVSLPELIVSYSSPSSSFHSLAFDIYNNIMFFLMLYLLASILWTILNISTMLAHLARDSCKRTIKIDLFNSDKIGGLGPIRDFLIKLILYYSLGISLAILSYNDPTGYSSVKFEILFFLLLLLAGIALLVSGLEHLQKIFRGRMIEELDYLNKRYQSQYEKLTEGISENNEDEWQSSGRLMDVLHKERSERERILDDNTKNYSYSAVFAALISIIFPLFTLFEKLNGYGLSIIILKAFNITN